MLDNFDAANKNYISYNHPLNEKIRVFLRIEHLWDEIEYFIKQENDATCLICLQNILSLLDIVERFDLRSEASKYLDKLVEKFQKIRIQPAEDIDRDKIDEIIQDLAITSRTLKTSIGKTASGLSSNEWLSTIRQKMLLPGGLSGSDSPFLKHWQQFSINQKINQLRLWQKEFAILVDAINKILFYIRKTSVVTEVRVENGVYQRMIDNQFEPQLLVIELPRRYNVYPEISGNRYRIAARFLQSDLINKAVQYTSQIDFRLAVCW